MYDSLYGDVESYGGPIPEARRYICVNTLLAQLDLYLDEFAAVVVPIRASINGAINFLKTISFSPGDLLDKKLKVARKYLAKQLNKVSKMLSGVDELMDIMNSCPFFKNNLPSKGPSALVKEIGGGVVSGVYSGVRKLLKQLPEFNAATLLAEIMNNLTNLQIPKLTKNIWDIITCISKLCAINIRDRINRFYLLLRNSWIKGTGSLDIDNVLASAGIVKPMQRENIIKSLNMIQATKDQTQDAVTKAVNEYKPLF
jgi:hypothetical protein